MGTSAEIDLMINDCLNRESKMSEWEREFIWSIAWNLNSNELSQKQLAHLEKIWDRIT